MKTLGLSRQALLLLQCWDYRWRRSRTGVVLPRVTSMLWCRRYSDKVNGSKVKKETQLVFNKDERLVQWGCLTSHNAKLPQFSFRCGGEREDFKLTFWQNRAENLLWGLESCFCNYVTMILMTHTWKRLHWGGPGGGGCKWLVQFEAKCHWLLGLASVFSQASCCIDSLTFIPAQGH